jgi:ribosomal protein S14
MMALNILLATTRSFTCIDREAVLALSAPRVVAFLRLPAVACSRTRRIRGSVGFFQLSRFKLKQLAESGLLPGVKRLSW